MNATKFTTVMFLIVFLDLIAFAAIICTEVANAQSACITLGYPQADVDFHLKPYCFNSLTARPL